MNKPIKNNSQLLYLQARHLFEDARSKFEDGSIKSEPLLVTAVFNSFQEFFTSMGAPNFVARYAPEEGPPWSEDYNDMMNELRADLELLFQEVDILGRSLYSDFNHNMVQHEILTKQFETVLDKMRDLELYAGLSTDNKVEFGRDDFLNKSKIDYSRISGTPLEIIDGAVTLPQVNRENVATKAKINIVAGNRKANKFILGTESNGFPGNNTEIHSVTDDVLTNKNYIPTFLGEEDNHSDYTVVLDGSPNTWFEFEKVNVREQDKIRVAKNLGWSYQVHENQTIEWAEDPENGILKLHMQMILEEETVINQINCNMYTPPNYGAKTAIVKNILVSDGKEAPKSVLPKGKTDDQYSFHFPPVKAKVVSILFEQPYKYLTDIGHIFYEKKMQVEDNSEYAMDMATKKYKYAPRVDGPLISLEDLGVQVTVSESNVQADYRLLSAESTPRSIGETLNRLMDNVDMDTVDMGVEKFEGFRWAIGIRDIEVYACEYATEGELVTVPFYFEKPMDKISLNVNENIPTVFASNPSLKYDWLKYFVSVDDGATWYPITPMSQEVVSEEQPPKIYTVRMVETSDQQLEWKDNYIESEYPVYSLRMKIVARRPEDLTTEGFMLKDSASGTLPNNTFNQTSPIISSYTFNIETLNEIADSEESDRLAADVGSIGNPAPINPGTGEAPIDNGGWPEVDDPWGDDDGDGVPNWDDPDSSSYIPPSKRPLGGGYPRGNPGTYGGYSSGGGSGGGNSGGGTGGVIKQPGTYLTVKIANAKLEWCSDEDLLVKAQIYGPNPLMLAELYIGGSKVLEQSLSGNSQIATFLVSKLLLRAGTMTFMVRGYDTKGVASDVDIVNIIDCAGLLPEDRPQENEIDKISVVIDKKTTEICAGKDLVFYGTAYSPNEIKALTFTVNGTSFDPSDLGIQAESVQTVEPEVIVLSTNQTSQPLTDKELMEIDDFGEWLEAFEEREDCGCRNKKKAQAVPQFQMQSTPFRMMATSEKTFSVTLPYSKLQELGATLNSSVEIIVTGIDSLNQTASDSFTVFCKDCNKPPTDENGNPRVRDCLMLESVEVHFFNFDSNSIESRTIPVGAIPFEGISNGAGSSITVGWRTDTKAPILMQTSGNDESGYTFQIHAVGLHYQDEYDQPKVKWSTTIGMKSPSIKNEQKMIGDPTKSSVWTEDMASGDFSTSPSLGKLNDYVEFIMDNEWLSKACDPKLPNFDPTRAEEPEKTKINDCNTLTHVVFQYYHEASKELRMMKVDISSTGKETYNLTTKNGNVVLAAGWVNYFNGPAIQIKSATGTDNILLTAIGIIYIDVNGDAQTEWSNALRYKTNGAQYPEAAIGGKKDLSGISWIESGTVNYAQATFIGKQGDLVAYRIDESFTEVKCETERPMDEDMGIDPTNPPDLPQFTFENLPEKICIDDMDFLVTGTASDIVGVKEIKYGVTVNNVSVIGPYDEEISGLEYKVDFPIRTGLLQVGDKVTLHAEVTNIFGVSIEKSEDLLVEICDRVPPVVTLTTSMIADEEGKYYYNDLVDGTVPVTLRVTDNIDVLEWIVSSGTWSQTERYTSAAVARADGDLESVVQDTGEIAINVLVTVPAKVMGENGREYIPDSTITITVKGMDGAENATTQSLIMNFTDFIPDLEPPKVSALVSGNLVPNAKGFYSYSDLVDGMIPINVTASDDIKLDSISFSHGAWSKTVTAGGNGTALFNVPIEVPAGVTDNNGWTRIPDKEYVFTASAIDHLGKEANIEYRVTLTDTTYDPSTIYAKTLGLVSGTGSAEKTHKIQSQGATSGTTSAPGIGMRYEVIGTGWARFQIIHPNGDQAGASVNEATGEGSFVAGYQPYTTNIEEAIVRVTTSSPSVQWRYRMGDVMSGSERQDAGNVSDKIYRIHLSWPQYATPINFDIYATINGVSTINSSTMTNRYDGANGSMSVFTKSEIGGIEIIDVNGLEGNKLSVSIKNMSGGTIPSGQSAPNISIKDVRINRTLGSTLLPAKDWENGEILVFEVDLKKPLLMEDSNVRTVLQEGKLY